MQHESADPQPAAPQRCPTYDPATDECSCWKTAPGLNVAEAAALAVQISEQAQAERAARTAAECDGDPATCPICDHTDCTPAPAATGNPAAEPTCDRQQGHMGWLVCPVHSKELYGGVASIEYQRRIAAGKAATGERHEFEPDEKGYVCLHGLARGDVGWIACFRPADAAVHRPAEGEAQ